MITASLVKELREKTGAGMLDCKKALEATNGNIRLMETMLVLNNMNFFGEDVRISQIHVINPKTLKGTWAPNE